MAYVIGMVSQKGGVGKSTLARLIAREAVAGGLRVKIADLDIRQKTTENWSRRRATKGIKPEIRVEVFANVHTALAEADNFDVYIFDGAPEASTQTKRIAEKAGLMVLPTTHSMEDINPAIELAHDLVNSGISEGKIAFALCLLSDSAAEEVSTRRYLCKTPYKVLPGKFRRKDALKNAVQSGKTLTETGFRTMAREADELAQSVIDAVSVTERQVA